MAGRDSPRLLLRFQAALRAPGTPVLAAPREELLDHRRRLADMRQQLAAPRGIKPRGRTADADNCDQLAVGTPNADRERRQALLELVDRDAVAPASHLGELAHELVDVDDCRGGVMLERCLEDGGHALIVKARQQELADRACMLWKPATDVIRGSDQPGRVELRDDIELPTGNDEGQIDGLLDLLHEAFERSARERGEHPALKTAAGEP